jgi:hypothetical protein
MRGLADSDAPAASRVAAGNPVDWTSVGLAFGLSWTSWTGLRTPGAPFLLRAAVGMSGPAAAAWLVATGRLSASSIGNGR